MVFGSNFGGLCRARTSTPWLKMGRATFPQRLWPHWSPRSLQTTEIVTFAFFFSYMLHPLTIARPRHSRRKISCWWSSSGMRPRNSHIFVALACLGAAYLSCDTVSVHFFGLPCMHWRGTEPLSRASKHLLGRCLNPQNLYDLYADIILNDPKLRLEV